MSSFDTLFPNFASTCASLQTLLMPVAYLLLVTGMVLAMIAGHRSPEAVLGALGRTIVYIIVLTQLTNWGNQISTITSTTVTNVLHADPSNVYQQYNQALQAQQSTTSQNSWWQKLFHVGTSIFEALISGLLWIFGLLASVIVFYAYLIQKFILYLGYALSPIFIGFLAIRALNQIGVNYLMALVGVMLWPLGWGAASLVTSGLITFMTDQSFLWNQSINGAAGYAFQNFIGVAALGVWLIFSTIAAPVIIQRVITHGVQAGAALISGLTTATTTAAAGGFIAAGSFGAGGGVAGAAMATAGGLTVAGTTLVGSSLSGSTYSPTGSMITALGQMYGANASASKRERNDATLTPSTLDVSGDNAVQALLRKTKNPHSPQT
ncbi:MAG TPA: type IV secretion system protein [Verrucomicrobiae bacterium]|nr:type IV secretion system protein [Verrucomicrobiae bacterium]